MRSILFSLMTLCAVSFAFAEEKTEQKPAEAAPALVTSDDIAQKPTDAKAEPVTEAVTSESAVAILEKLSAIQLNDLLEPEGFAMKVKNQEGEESLTWKIEGYEVDILLSRDEQVIQVHTAFDLPITLEKLNQWNRDNLFTHSFLDENQKPCLELELDLAGGVTKDRIVRFFQMARKAVLAWEQHLSQK